LASYDVHRTAYERFGRDADNESNYEGTRVEAYFLSAFHLIEACAAMERVHINKHRRVRQSLEENSFIFGDDTETVWRSFQRIENQLRPKFTYSFTWSRADLEEVKKKCMTIEDICLRRLG
jgi:hypothetical protein